MIYMLNIDCYECAIIILIIIIQLGWDCCNRHFEASLKKQWACAEPSACRALLRWSLPAVQAKNAVKIHCYLRHWQTHCYYFECGDLDRIGISRFPRQAVLQESFLRPPASLDHSAPQVTLQWLYVSHNYSICKEMKVRVWNWNIYIDNVIILYSTTLTYNKKQTNQPKDI